MKITARKPKRQQLRDGVIITVKGYGDIPVQVAPDDMINLMTIEGLQQDPVRFRDGNNVVHTLKRREFLDLLRQAREAVCRIHENSWRQ